MVLAGKSEGEYTEYTELPRWEEALKSDCASAPRIREIRLSCKVMKAELTEDVLRECLLSAEIGFRVRTRVAEVTGADMGPAHAARQKLFLALLRHGFDDWLQKKERGTIASEAFDDLVESTLSAYDDDTFWIELEARLGERDFFLYASDAEVEAAEKTGKLPERVEWYYRKYRHEFHRHGTDRLEIDEDL